MNDVMSDKKIIARILIADGNPLFREKMKQIIADNFESILTYEASGENEVLDEISRHAFDVLILDLELSGGNGLTLLKNVMITIPDIPVLVLSMFPVKQYEENVLKEGACGYLSKVNLSDELIVALEKLFHGERYVASLGTDGSGEKA
jgi:two-component system, NarL family, invasion response regulator UvrY